PADAAERHNCRGASRGRAKSFGAQSVAAAKLAWPRAFGDAVDTPEWRLAGHWKSDRVVSPRGGRIVDGSSGAVFFARLARALAPASLCVERHRRPRSA